MEILWPEHVPDHQLHNSLPSSCPPPLLWVMTASRFLLLQGASRRRHVWYDPFIPAWHKAESPLLTCFYHKFLQVGAIILVKLQKKSLRKKKREMIICRFSFLPPSSPATPVLKFRHGNNTQQCFRQACACIWYKQTKICAFCFIELTSIWQNLNHKTEILWLINTSGDEK